MKEKLRVMHYPQIPCSPFRVDVDNIDEAYKIMNTLADYDLFQFKENIKPDYSNMTTLEEWDTEDEMWYDWIDDETGIDDIDQYMLYMYQQRGGK